MTTPIQSKHFEELVTKCGATPHGAKWLKQALDPFHDVDLDIVGYPDVSSGRSFVANVTKTIEITKPTSAGTGNYDAHVAFNPVMIDDIVNRFTVDSSTGFPKSINWTAISNKSFDASNAVNVCRVPSGSPTFTGATAEEFTSVGFDEYFYRQGSNLSRLVGMGIEVHNTTANVSKQGSVCCYKFDNPRGHMDIFSSGGNFGAVSGGPVRRYDIVAGPPTNLADAKMMNGVTWEAEDGAYVPVVMEQENKPKFYLPADRALWQHDASTGNTYVWTNGAFEDTNVRLAATPAVTMPTGWVMSSVDLSAMSCGAYFTGLSTETTLTVTIRAFVEVFPHPSSSLMAIALSAPSFDSKALQCYSEISRELHAGYPVGFNAHGDYFKKVLGVAKQLAKPMILEGLGTLGISAPAATAGYATAEALLKQVTKKKKKTKTQNKK